MTSTTRDPAAGELKLVVLIGAIQFHAFQPIEGLDALMDAVERRLENGPALRGDRLAQMSLRQWVASRLRSDDVDQAQARFNDICGAACIWLALRHYEGSRHMHDAIHRHAGEGMVLTIAIGDSPHSAEGTSWSFMLGRTVLDGRGMLEGQPSDRLSIYGSDVPGGWRDCVFHPKT